MDAFISRDLRLALECQVDIVQGVDQAVAAEIVYLELDRQPVLVGDRAAFDIDCQLIARVPGRADERSSTADSSRRMGNMPFLKQLL